MTIPAEASEKQELAVQELMARYERWGTTPDGEALSPGMAPGWLVLRAAVTVAASAFPWPTYFLVHSLARLLSAVARRRPSGDVAA